MPNEIFPSGHGCVNIYERSADKKLWFSRLAVPNFAFKVDSFVFNDEGMTANKC
jgi:hypothetical protein